MKNDNRKRFKPYTQVQQWTVRVLFIVLMCVSGSPQNARAELPGPAQVVKCIAVMASLLSNPVSPFKTPVRSILEANQAQDQELKRFLGSLVPDGNNYDCNGNDGFVINMYNNLRDQPYCSALNLENLPPNPTDGEWICLFASFNPEEDYHPPFLKFFKKVECSNEATLSLFFSFVDLNEICLDDIDSTTWGLWTEVMHALIRYLSIRRPNIQILGTTVKYESPKYTSSALMAELRKQEGFENFKKAATEYAKCLLPGLETLSLFEEAIQPKDEYEFLYSPESPE